MVDVANTSDDTNARREGIRHGGSVHPTNPFVRFTVEEVEQSIPARFEQQVARFSDRLALKNEGHEHTYCELNTAANRVAHAILAHMHEGEHPVAVLLETSAELITATLGMWKAGKFYVPLNTSYPSARISYMLEDSGARLIVTNNKHLSLAVDLAQDNYPVLNIDEIDPQLSGENLGLAISPDSIAYVSYTSGSTGQPKGVIQTHRSRLHRFLRHTNTQHICPDDRLSLLGVGSGVGDILNALLNGAAAYPLDITEREIGYLADWLISEEITVYHSAATIFRQFVEGLAGDEEFPKLRLVILGGEAIYKRDVEAYRKHFPPSCLFANRMAGTEFGLILEYFVNKETPISEGIVPVGYPAEEVKVLLLDDGGNEVGFDTVGQISLIVSTRTCPMCS